MDKTVSQGGRLYAVRLQKVDIFLEDGRPKAVADVVHPLAESFLGRDAPGNAKGKAVELLVVIHLVHRFEAWLAHAEHSEIGEDDIAILYLVLRTVRRDIHTVQLFDEVALSKQRADNRQATCRDDPFISEFDNNILLFSSVRRRFLFMSKCSLKDVLWSNYTIRIVHPTGGL